VKQNYLGEYEKNVREKQNTQYTRQKHYLPLKLSHMDGKHQFATQEGSNETTRFLNAKGHTPSEAKAKHTKCQPQDKHRPLNQQSKSKHIWPRHKSHKSDNNHQ
jgi:hypothetical protein